MSVKLIPAKKFHAKLANLPGVRSAIDDAAQDIKEKAEQNLASHKKSGDAHVVIDTDGVDAVVSLVASETGKGWAPASIEFGNERHPGLYVLYSAAGLV